jgi:hypothetical protein
MRSGPQSRRRVSEPRPLTDADLKQLEAQSAVTGLSSIDARRLVAEVRRLRLLVHLIQPWMSGLHSEARSRAEVDVLRELVEHLEREVRS